MSAAEALAAVTRRCIADLTTQESILKRERAPEALHQMRVALRRWRAALSVFKDLIPAKEEAALKAELKWLAGEFDEARDLDVFAARSLAARPDGDPPPEGRPAFEAALARARTRAYDLAVSVIDSDRYRKLLWEAARGLARSPWSEAARTPAREIAKKALAKRLKTVRKCGAAFSSLDPAGRHRLRIQSKKLRYAAELLAELFGHKKRQRRLGAALKDLQGALGDLNDIHVARGIAERLAVQAGGPEAAFAGGLLVGSRAAEEAGLLKDARAAYERVVEAEPFW